ncbi:MAG: hypothetical protein CMN30_21830 [Sandaracinus sp.]|nr:hypothetical protein [Sandaracinus sp.]|tara:strand:- start:650 stop:2188 length:1539 start_codon:yes stop_codon:yes gene_type:complete
MRENRLAVVRTLAFKLFVLLLAFAAIPGGVLAWWTLRHMEQSQIAASLEAMDGMVTTKAEAVERFMADRRANVERMASLVASRVEVLERATASDVDDPEVEELPDLEDGSSVEGTGSPAPPGDTTADEGETPEDEEPGDESEADEEAEEEAGQASEGDEPQEATAGTGAPAQEPFEPRLDDIGPDPEELQVGSRRPRVEDAEIQLRRKLSLVLWDRSEFEELLVIDRDGYVRVSTFEGHEDTDASGVEYFQQGLRGTFVQPVFLSPITERFTMVVSTPVYSMDRAVIGVLAVRLNLEHFFGILTEAEGLGETGETIAAQDVDGELVLRAPTRNGVGDGPGTVLDSRDIPVALAARGEAGKGIATDLRGERVVAAWRHLDELGWGLVSKVDYDEATDPVEQITQELWLALLMIIIVAALVAVVAANAIVRPIRQLRSAADRVSRGDLDVEVDVRSRDEVGQLAESFERMVAAIRYFRERGESKTGLGDIDEDESLRREIEAEEAALRGEEPPE